MVCPSITPGEENIASRNTIAEAAAGLPQVDLMVGDLLLFVTGYPPVLIIPSEGHHACCYDVKALKRFNSLQFSYRGKESSCAFEYLKEEIPWARLPRLRQSLRFSAR